MKMFFRRRRCGICGRKPTVKIVKGHAKTPHYARVWLCRIYCDKHCPVNGIALASNNREFAKARAVSKWNRTQQIYIRGTVRLLEKLFGKREREDERL